jgi:hydroxypyruvate reductase/glycerate 2-kinase
MPPLRDDALAIWQAGVAAVQPSAFIPNAVEALDLSRTGSLVVVGAGKAGAGMVRALESALGPEVMKSRRVRGLVNVIDSFADEARPGIRLHAARPEGDPLPTPAGITGSEAMLELVRSLGPDDTVIALISGGASALLPLPVAGVTLAEKRETTMLLSKAGATIGELNTVRKHLSRIKGGRLAADSQAGQWVSLILSDVIGNPLDVIASGPTVPDPTTYADALAVIARFKLETRLPASVMRHLHRGRQRLEPETPKSLPPSIVNRIVADNGRALQAAAKQARRLGYAVEILPDPIQGESRVAGKNMARLVLERQTTSAGKPICVLAGGEPVVSRVAPGGKGGRNQEFALGAFAGTAGTGFANCCLLAAGTDGEDGPTDAAGAFYDEPLRLAALAKRLDPMAYFLTSRSYDFFAKTGGLLKTGPTGTNVMDLVVLLKEKM